MSPWRRVALPFLLSLLCLGTERTFAYLLAAREPLADLIVGRYWSAALIVIVLGSRLLFFSVLAPWLGVRVVQGVLGHVVTRRR